MSWNSVTLGEVCKVIAGQSPEGKYYNKDGKGLPFYQGKKDFGSIYIKSPSVWTTEVTKEAIKDDILMSVRAPVGPVNISIENICIGRGLAAIRAADKIDKSYLFNFLLSIEKNLIGSSGAVFNSINKSQIENLLVPLPPLATQKKIVAKLDAIFAEIDKATAAAEANAKNARISVGKIIDEVIHEKIENYTALTLNDITEVITCGVAKRPDYVESGVPFLSARNVKNGKIKWDRYEFVSEVTHNILSKYNKPKIGDILYSRVGAGFGDAAIIDRDIEFSIFVSLTLIKVKPVLLNEFLCYYLNSPHVKEVARKNITGTGVGNLNVGAVRLFKIKLPNLLAQRTIVQELDFITQNGKTLVDSYAKKVDELSLLKQAILKQAFSGELVKE